MHLLCYILLLFCYVGLGLCFEQLLHPSKNIDVDQFLDSHSAYNKYAVDHKSFNSTTLAYVTPWNKLGYEVAETFTHKFNLLAPVWFQVLGKKKSYTVTGLPNIDEDWIRRIRHRDPAVQIVPRFIFEEWTSEDYSVTLKDNNRAKQCIANIIRIVNNHKFDGAVLETWSQFSGVSDKDMIAFLQLLAEDIHNSGKLFILVIPPGRYRGGYVGRFTKTHFDRLYDHVDYFSLMTYDFSSPNNPGPNSPIDWVRECIMNLVPDHSRDLSLKRAKILVGLNFYGMLYAEDRSGSKPILGHEFVDVVRQSRAPLKWIDDCAEHVLEFSQPNGDKFMAYYPTLLSIAQRLALLSSTSTGVSIWEIGQGLHSFYSLF